MRLTCNQKLENQLNLPHGIKQTEMLRRNGKQPAQLFENEEKH